MWILWLCVAIAQAQSEEAKRATELAIAVANNGDLVGALGHFERAVGLAPTDANYWSNLGVTQMRLGLLSEARSAFEQSAKIDPSLTKHLAVLDQYEQLGPWFRNSSLRAALGKQVRSGGLAQIRGFLDPDLARALHAELKAANYSRAQGYSRFYQFQFDILREFDNNGRRVARLFQTLTNWAAELLGVQPSYFDDTICHATRYGPGDYTMVHSDFLGNRRLSYVLHLTDDWNVEDGGDLVFLNPLFHVHPGFNVMTVFLTTDVSWHFVSPVHRNDRLAFSGWFTSPLPLPPALDTQNKRRHNDEAMRRFRHSAVVDGATGTFLDYQAHYDSLDASLGWASLL